MPRTSTKRNVPRRPNAVWRPYATPVVSAVARPAPPPPPPKPVALPSAEEAMDGPDPRPLIDRRQMPRVAFAAAAALAPADATGAVRQPAIRTRDLNPLGLGFVSRQDLSVLGEAVLRLPGPSGRVVCVPCRVRRSRELGNGWFDGLVEFLQPQPMLTVKDNHALLPRPSRRGR